MEKDMPFLTVQEETKQDEWEVTVESRLDALEKKLADIIAYLNHEPLK